MPDSVGIDGGAVSTTLEPMEKWVDEEKKVEEEDEEKPKKRKAVGGAATKRSTGRSAKRSRKLDDSDIEILSDNEEPAPAGRRKPKPVQRFGEYVPGSPNSEDESGDEEESVAVGSAVAGGSAVGGAVAGGEAVGEVIPMPSDIKNAMDQLGEEAKMVLGDAVDDALDGLF